MTDNNERDFKGVWIPKRVWLDARLSALDKIILAEIDSLDKGDRGCWASNKHIADFCQCSETKVSTAISKLVKLGYLRLQSFDGRQRILKSCLSENESLPLKKCEADYKNLRQSNPFSSTESNDIEYGGEIVSPETIVDLYNTTCPSLMPLKYLTRNRREAITAALSTYTVEQLRQCFQIAENTEFLKGKNPRSWKATFDWLMVEENMVKVLEGNYANIGGKPESSRSDEEWDDFFKAAMARSYNGL